MPQNRVTVHQRSQVSERAKGYCEYCYCQEQFATESFCVDHIIPRAKGGRTTLDNLTFACPGCNSHKYVHTHAVDPATDELVPLFNPQMQAWKKHFTWSDDFIRIVGITPVGCATVVALKMNRPSVINLRRLLLLVDQHPPKL